VCHTRRAWQDAVVSGQRPSLRLTIVAVVAVLAACAFAAWLVFDVGCDVAPEFFLFRQFCDKDFWTVAAPVLGLTLVLLVLAAVAQTRGGRPRR
jgi:hypothetical protein